MDTDLAVFGVKSTNERQVMCSDLLILVGTAGFAENYQPAQKRLAMPQLQQTPLRGSHSSLRFYRRYLTTPTKEVFGLTQL
jgi:hypothetical protein